MGMMGRLSERDRELIGDGQIIDVRELRLMISIGIIGMRYLVSLGEFRGKPDQSKLYEKISVL